MSYELKIFGRSILSFQKFESRSLENPSVSLTDANAWNEAFGSEYSTATNARVSAETAIKVSAVFRAVSLLSGTMAALPLNVYRRDKEDNRSLALDHPAYWLLHTEPNPVQSSFYFRETMMTHLLLSDGNAYAYIQRDINYIPSALVLLDPAKVTPILANGSMWYFIKGVKDPVPARDIIHIAGLGFDGIKGKTPLRIAREVIGQGLTLQDFASYFFANGSHIGGVIEHPAKMSEPQYNRFLDSWRKAYKGVTNQGKTAILEGGAQYKPVGIPPEEAQFLQSRKFNVTEIARIFGVAPHKLYDLERSTNNNIEHQGIEFVQDTISILAARIESELNRKMFREDERTTHYTKFNMNALLRGDIKSRASYYQIMRNVTAMTADEIRKKEDMNPKGGAADELLFPLNMATETQIKNNENENANAN